MRPQSRTVWTLFAAVCLTGCTAPPQQSVPTEPAALPQPDLNVAECVMPEKCEDAVGNAVISIDAKGEATPPCVRVENKFNVTWRGAKGAGIDQLSIQFKIRHDGIKNPQPPICSGPFCFVDAESFPPGEPDTEVLYCYATALHTESGGTAWKDPKLIIKY